MDCVRAMSVLHGYLDDELDVMHVQEFQTHLEGCASCARQHAQEHKLRSLLQRGALRYKAPARFRAKVVGSVRPARKEWGLSSWVPAGWLQFGGSLATAALLSSVVTYYAVLASNADRIVDEVVASHVRSLVTNHLVDVESSDEHTVKPWFNGRLDFAPLVKDLSEQGFPLAGGRVDYVDGRPVAALLYRHRQHWISVFMRPDQSDGHTTTRQFSKRGYAIAQ